MGDDGYVYVLHNCEHRQPTVKIGRTTKSVPIRAKELDSTGSPGAFTALFSVRVTNCRIVERLVMQHLSEYRLRERREFFRVAPDLAIRTLLDASAPYLIDPVIRERQFDVLPPLLAQYEGLLDPALTSAVIEVREDTVVLTCAFRRSPPTVEETIERTDLSILRGGPYEFDPADLEGAMDEFLSLDPFDYIRTTPLFAEREARLIDLLGATGEEEGPALMEDELSELVRELADEIRRGTADVDEVLRRLEAHDGFTLSDFIGEQPWSARPR